MVLKIRLYICGIEIRDSNNQIKIKVMTQAIITKTLAKIDNQPSNYSIGFRRLTVLPKRVRKNINMACVLKGESNDNSMKDFFNELTEQEYINWLRLA